MFVPCPPTAFANHDSCDRCNVSALLSDPLRSDRVLDVYMLLSKAPSKIAKPARAKAILAAQLADEVRIHTNRGRYHMPCMQLHDCPSLVRGRTCITNTEMGDMDRHVPRVVPVVKCTTQTASCRNIAAEATRNLIWHSEATMPGAFVHVNPESWKARYRCDRSISFSLARCIP